MGHFSSEYVMIYKDKNVGEYLDKCYEDHERLFRDWAGKNQEEKAWPTPVAADGQADPQLQGRSGTTRTRINPWCCAERPPLPLAHAAVTKDDSLWTDDYSYIIGVLR